MLLGATGTLKKLFYFITKFIDFSFIKQPIKLNVKVFDFPVFRCPCFRCYRILTRFINLRRLIFEENFPNTMTSSPRLDNMFKRLFSLKALNMKRSLKDTKRWIVQKFVKIPIETCRIRVLPQNRNSSKSALLKYQIQSLLYICPHWF